MHEKQITWLKKKITDMFPQAKIPSKYKFFPAYPSSYILQITAFNRTISINDHLITVIMHSFSTTTYVSFFFFLN